MSDQSSKDRADLCTFIFDDGRHCNMLHTGNELRLCYFHEKKEMQRLLAKDAGLKVSRYLATNLHTACDLNAAFAMLFRAGAQGYADAKAINSLTRLGHLMLKTHLLAKEEYLSTYDREWPEIVEKSAVFSFDCNTAELPQPPGQSAEPQESGEPADQTTEEAEEQEETKAGEEGSEVEETDEREEPKEAEKVRESAVPPSSDAAKDQSDKDDSSSDDSTADDSAEDSSESDRFNGDVPLLTRSQLLSLVNRYNAHHRTR